MSDDWKGKNVLVLGLGDTGLSSVRWLAKRGARLRVADTRAAPPSLGALRNEQPAVRVSLGSFDEALLAGVDTVVASPGLALREPLLRAAVARGLEVLGDVEIFAREVARRSPGARVLGITGTNGKSTVTALAGAMGRAAGFDTAVAGNIGLPVLDALDALDGEKTTRTDLRGREAPSPILRGREAPSPILRGREAPSPILRGREAPSPILYVLELSSYQLETTSSLALDAAVMLNLTQDHMDRYDSMEDYAKAKQRIFRHAKTRVVNRDDPWSLGMALGERTFSFGRGVPRSGDEWGLDEAASHIRRGHTDFIALGEMALTGMHNAANAMAAHALLSALDAPPEPLARALREFKGLEHRVEFVTEAKGVRFFDDSKGTNVGATVAALEGFRDPVVLIAGGEGKGQDFSPLAPAVKSRARAVVLLGRDAPLIAAALAKAEVPLARVNSIEEAVEAAFALAQPGDAVLLSPACASFDMFRDYGHRGALFSIAARALASREGR